MIGKKWGLKPKMLEYVYQRMVKPMILYASFEWYEKSKTTSKNRSVTHPKLQKVQRLFLLMTTGAMRSTTTDALEAMLNIHPSIHPSSNLCYDSRRSNYGKL